MSFSSGCGVCGKTDGLRCSGCKVMMYCGVEHQTAHRQEHKSACSAIRRSRVAMEKEEQALRAQPDDIFAHGVGKFWMIFETRPYMRARAALSDAMTVVKSYESLQAQLDILLENLRLCRGDNMGSRDVIPGLMICLQQDHECYDFLKWWATTGSKPDYDWGNNTLPYLDIQNANPLEPVEMFCERMVDLPHMVAMTLIKAKVLQVLFTKVGSPDGSTVPNLGFGLESSTIAKNPNVVNCGDKWLEIVKLKAQIRALYKAVQKLNPHFWPALVNPDEHLNAKPMMFSIGSVEQMQMTLNLTYEAWHEAPGAIVVIEMAIEGKL